MYKNRIKPFLDICISLLLLIIISPVIFIITLILLITNRGLPFFIQLRPGKNGKVFNLIKFKTMNDKKEINGSLLEDKYRLTKLGKIFRTISLDELPQLFNVLKGDMSLIGPRPLLVDYLPLYSEEQARRHEVRPGMTGWAQVNGRNAITWEEKFKLDIWYVDNLSFRLDMVILWKTALKVLKREGINSGSATTIEPFRGNN